MKQTCRLGHHMQHHTLNNHVSLRGGAVSDTSVCWQSSRAVGVSDEVIAELGGILCSTSNDSGAAAASPCSLRSFELVVSTFKEQDVGPGAKGPGPDPSSERMTTMRRLPSWMVCSSWDSLPFNMLHFVRGDDDNEKSAANNAGPLWAGPPGALRAPATTPAPSAHHLRPVLIERLQGEESADEVAFRGNHADTTWQKGGVRALGSAVAGPAVQVGKVVAVEACVRACVCLPFWTVLSQH